MPIILLDLNFTLVSNSRELGPPFRPDYPVERETYRQWLVDLVRGHHVELITVRPDFFTERSLANIARLCQGWQPQGHHFNPHRGMRAPVWKEKALRESIFPKFGTDPTQYLALESNADTRAMYAKAGINAVPVPINAAWSRLPDFTPPPRIDDGTQTSLF